MSKQSEAKAKQGYVPKAVPQTCANCEHFTFIAELPAWMRNANARLVAKGVAPTYGDNLALQTNLRCGLGGFAVKKMGTCNQWAGVAEESK